jgi:hypothetical protein
VLLVRDRDRWPSPLAQGQFVGYGELQQLQLSV